jgi:TRAP-type C4-dicarboxylate transport system permease small subunit
VTSLAAILSSLTVTDGLPLGWLSLALAPVGAAIALIVLVRRPIDVRALGCVSDRWIATHRTDSS